MEKILSLDPNVPSALLYKIQREIENEDFDTAEESLSRLKTLQPFGENVFRQQIALYRKKKQNEKITDVSHEAYLKHPNVWDFVYLEAALAQQKTRATTRSEEIVNKYLQDNYSTNALSTLAEYSVTGTDLSTWESYYDKMIELEPAAPGYQFRMARVYSGLHEYTKAEQALKSAIAICPNSDAFWSELGEVYRVQKDNRRSIAAYENALKFNPANYDARENLRELRGRKSIFSQFASVNVDSAIKAAPRKTGNDHGVVLIDDTKRVVFDKGTSVAQREMVVKLFDKTGIDQYKEFGIPFNPYTETLIIEKAVTVKGDGSEIKADVARNGVVFKQLEEGDCISFKWKTKNN
jgi:tetratricopeptide (TPR) repeat protein